MQEVAFWESKTLAELDESEWESLCDGCGLCCLAKIEDADDGEILFTRVACRLLDTERCRCNDYDKRIEKVPDCMQLSAENIDSIPWLPSTCAYRLRHESKPLFEWHPLISGSSETVHSAGISVRGRVISEQFVHPDGLEEHIVHWVQ
jgi:uncharacterized protein